MTGYAKFRKGCPNCFDVPIDAFAFVCFCIAVYGDELIYSILFCIQIVIVAIFIAIVYHEKKTNTQKKDLSQTTPTKKSV